MCRDLGFFLSYKTINETSISNDIKEKILKIYSDTLYNTVNGEIIDVFLPFESIEYHKAMKENTIYDIYINKTAWYTIIGPLLIGAYLAGCDKESEQKLIKIGLDLGIAFQIKDDLLGLYSESQTLGKTINDIKEGKQTIIYKHAIDNANEEELNIIKKYYGKSNITFEESTLIADLFEKIGSRKNAEDLVEKYTNSAIYEIKNSDFQNKELFIEFCNYLLRRKK